MEPETPIDIDQAFEDGTLIDEAMNEAAENAIRQHQFANVPLVCWRNGRIEIVSPFDPSLAETNGDADHD